jgi:hypothetical protein
MPDFLQFGAELPYFSESPESPYRSELLIVPDIVPPLVGRLVGAYPELWKRRAVEVDVVVVPVAGISSLASDSEIAERDVAEEVVAG